MSVFFFFLLVFHCNIEYLWILAVRTNEATAFEHVPSGLKPKDIRSALKKQTYQARIWEAGGSGWSTFLSAAEGRRWNIRPQRAFSGQETNIFVCMERLIGTVDLIQCYTGGTTFHITSQMCLDYIWVKSLFRALMLFHKTVCPEVYHSNAQDYEERWDYSNVTH